MKPDPLVRELYSALAEGLARPQHVWTVGVVVLALIAGWFAARLMRRRVDRRLAAARASGQPALDALRVSLEGFRRLAFPAITLGLLILGQTLLRAVGVFRTADDARLLQLAITLLAAMAAIRLIVYILRNAFAGVAVLANFERGLSLFIWLIVALYLAGILADVVAWLEATTLQIGKASVSLWIIIMGLLSLAVTVLAALWLGSVIEARVLRSRTLDASLRVVLARIAKALLLLVAVLIGLSAVGIDVTVLSVFGGALGVGLGLGLQRIASNYVSGFILLLDRSLRLGDLITVENYHGVVAEISTRYTVIRALDGTEAIVPNEVLVSSPVTNHTYTDRRSRVAVRVSVAYDTDVKQAMALLVEAAREHPRALADPAPAALVLGFGADGLDLEVGLWIGDPERGKGNVQSDVAQGILQRFRSAGIEIPYPQRDVRVTHVNPGPAAAGGNPVRPGD
jgi:small-conductance mechanosensitive channel